MDVIEVVTAVLVFGIGAIIGSYVNVLLLRAFSGQGTVARRSRCGFCGHTLSWYELIPLISWLLQGGRCRHCTCRLSRQYLLVELSLGTLWLLSWWKDGLTLPGAVSALIMTVLLSIFVYDVRHKIIPDRLVVVLGILALCKLALLPGALFEISPAAYSGALLGGIFYLLWFITRGRGVGLGDAKLGITLGLLTANIVHTWQLFLVAIWGGALFGLALLTWSKVFGAKKINGKTELPFAPFLVLAYFVIWLLY